MSRLSVSMSGGAPWGFRLYGGGGDPLIVAKLRKRSKASEAGLVEGDVLLAINQYTTQNMSHPVAMALVDQAQGNLDFQVLRGSSDPNAVNSALQTLGAQYQAPPTSAPSAPAAAPAQAPAPVQAPAPAVNGFSQQPNVVRQQQTFNDGNTQRQVTTETKTEKFGGTTLTKVTRQEVTSSSYSSPPKPKTWQPVSGPSAPAAPKVTSIRAPPGVAVSQNPMDQSITLTLGLGEDNKENRPSPARNNPPAGYVPPSKSTTQQNMFRVNRVNTQQPKAIWQPSFIPDLPDRGPLEQTNLMEDMPDYRPEPEPVPEPAPAPQPTPSALRPADDFDGTRRPLLEQKKVYADSAFFDDPDHKYPTIEEQIKMARRVALSLESPANKKARGHKMFIKRKQKSYRWIAGADGTGAFHEVPETEVVEEEDEKYYHPDPWKSAGHTWQPPSHTGVPKPVLPVAPAGAIPPPPPINNFNWNKPVYKAPTLPFGGSEKEKEEKSKAMSQDEFERMRMFEQKTQHNKVSPQVSFKIADDLKNLKGKGAKLFAKRKAKAEEWVVEDKFSADQPDSAPRPSRNDPAFLMKLTGGMMPPPSQEDSPPTGPAPPSRPRLQQMIDPPKAAMTPWDAAVNYGSTEKAFDHLDDYMRMKRGDVKGQIAAKLSLSAKIGGGATQLSSPGQPTMPDYTRKIQPWDQPAQASPGFNPSSSSSSNSTGGFRPVKFKAPSQPGQFGQFAPAAPAPAAPAPVAEVPAAAPVSEEDGFCDL